MKEDNLKEGEFDKENLFGNIGGKVLNKWGLLMRKYLYFLRVQAFKISLFLYFGPLVKPFLKFSELELLQKLRSDWGKYSIQI